MIFPNLTLKRINEGSKVCMGYKKNKHRDSLIKVKIRASAFLQFHTYVCKIRVENFRSYFTVILPKITRPFEKGL